jgi:hypothetical protein
MYPPWVFQHHEHDCMSDRLFSLRHVHQPTVLLQHKHQYLCKLCCGNVCKFIRCNWFREVPAMPSGRMVQQWDVQQLQRGHLQHAAESDVGELVFDVSEW